MRVLITIAADVPDGTDPALLDRLAADAFTQVHEPADDVDLATENVTCSVSGGPVGAPEIAGRLGVTPQTVRIWKWRGLLPEPRWTVHALPAWEWADVEAWALSTGRLAPDSVVADDARERKGDQ